MAAFADRHLVVVKSRDGEVTETGVRPLDDAGRVRELARMLAGMAGLRQPPRRTPRNCCLEPGGAWDPPMQAA